MKARKKFKVRQRVKSTGEVIEKGTLGRVVGFTREGWVKVRLLNTETERVDHPDFWESAPPSPIESYLSSLRFDERAKCKICGKIGALDFNGDYVCAECLERIKDSKE